MRNCHGTGCGHHLKSQIASATGAGLKTRGESLTACVAGLSACVAGLTACGAGLNACGAIRRARPACPAARPACPAARPACPAARLACPAARPGTSAAGVEILAESISSGGGGADTRAGGMKRWRRSAPRHRHSEWRGTGEWANKFRANGRINSPLRDYLPVGSNLFDHNRLFR